MATLIKQLICHSTLTLTSWFRYCKLSVLYFFNGSLNFLIIPPRDQRLDKESRRAKVSESKQCFDE